MTPISYKDFLLQDVPIYLKSLKVEAKPQWGIMTPQHMVEHLIYVTKITMKRYGEPEPSRAAHQAKMQEFIKGEQIFPKSITPVNTTKSLKELRYGNLQEAIDNLEIALKKYYSFYEQNPDFHCYNPQMGELNFNLCERFHFKHYKHHLVQFGLIPESN